MNPLNKLKKKLAENLETRKAEIALRSCSVQIILKLYIHNITFCYRGLKITKSDRRIVTTETNVNK